MNFDVVSAEVARLSGEREVTVVAVSKQRSLEDILQVYRAGCRDFGENRVPEALEKIEKAPQDIRWHFIGMLQRKKVPKVIGKFALIHSVDSPELAKKISLCSADRGAETSLLLQVNTSGEKTKHGFSPQELQKMFPQLLELPNIAIKGLMTMAPLTDDKEQIQSCFSQLRLLRDEFQLHHLSMGMSHDYPIAITEGATLVRIGTAIFSC